METGGRIDHAHHYNNAYRALDETLAMETAVLAALAMVNPTETLIVVTSDHSHVLTLGGQATPRGHPILGPDSKVSDVDGQPYTTLLYGNGPGFATPRIVPMNTSSAMEDKNQVHGSAVPRQWGTHAGEDVPVYALGPLATTLFAGGRIDHAHHYNNAYRALDETLAMETAVLAALAMVNPTETLIVVTSDHSHVLTLGGQATPRGHPILGPDSKVSDVDGQPYTTLLYGNGPGFATPRIVPMNTSSAMEDKNQVHGSAVPRQWGTHAGEDVPVYALGPLATTLFAGGRIDHAHHYNNAYRALDETLAMETAVLAALAMVNPTETLIVVTSDHSHVLTLGGQATPRGHPILGPDSKVSDVDGQPYTTLLYGNGPGFATPRIVPMNTSSAMEDKNQVHGSAVPRQWGTHAGEDVPVYALGPLATTLFAGTFDQSYIPHAIAYSACLGEHRLRCQGLDNFVSTPPHNCTSNGEASGNSVNGQPIAVASSVMADDSHRVSSEGVVDSLEKLLLSVLAFLLVAIT
ncbi:hypothetical protein HUJ04_010855 [Dendroctonus ponderosae]|nr:hypothetical protein HUJ04_010855 [Dendroctonus ponderosae]